MNSVSARLFKTSLAICVSIAGCQKAERSTEDKFQPVEPALTITLDSPSDDPTTKNAGSADPDGETIRKLSLARL